MEPQTKPSQTILFNGAYVGLQVCWWKVTRVGLQVCLWKVTRMRAADVRPRLSLYEGSRP